MQYFFFVHNKNRDDRAHTVTVSGKNSNFHGPFKDPRGEKKIGGICLSLGPSYISAPTK